MINGKQSISKPISSVYTTSFICNNILQNNRKNIERYNYRNKGGLGSKYN
jgi:hypothetical protein